MERIILGEHEEALAAYEEALRISNGSPHLAISAAALYFDLDRLEETASHARLALASHPPFTHGLLAQIALQRHDLDEAERQAGHVEGRVADGLDVERSGRRKPLRPSRPPERSDTLSA